MYNFFRSSAIEAILSTTIIILIPKILLTFTIPFFILSYRVSYPAVINQPIFGILYLDAIILFVLGNFLFFKTLEKKNYFLFVLIPSVSLIIFSSVTSNNYALDVASVLIGLFSCIYVLSSKFFFSSRKMAFSTPKFFLIFFAILSGLELLSAARWIFYLISPDTIYVASNWHIARLESSVYNAFGRLVPYLIILIPFSFLLLPYKLQFSEIIRKKLGSSYQSISQQIEFTNSEQSVIKYRHLILIAIIALSISFAVMPFFHSVNPTDQPFGVDLPIYAERIDNTNELESFDFISHLYVTFNDKFLSYVFLYGLGNLFGISPLLATKSIFVILAPSFVLVTFFFVRYAFRNEKIALLSAFFASTSIYFVAGLYGGLIANFIGIIILFSLLYVCLRFLRTNSYALLFLAFFLLVCILFTHIYTWTYAILSLALFIGWSFYNYRKTKSKIKLLVLLSLVLVATVAVDFSKPVNPDVTTGHQTELEILSYALSTDQFFDKWKNLGYTAGVVFGGSFGNFFLLLLGLVWLLAISTKNDEDRLLGSMFFIVSPFVLFSGFEIQPRLMFFLPFSIVASLGTFIVLGKIRRFDSKLSWAFLSFIILYQIVYVLKLLPNFYFKINQ